ncbi:unnamed protein product [Pedinophyceae sp. YPF-701]|nr:unnamed protein product [Pedinophyceae sp. YPF-701]
MTDGARTRADSPRELLQRFGGRERRRAALALDVLSRERRSGRPLSRLATYLSALRCLEILRDEHRGRARLWGPWIPDSTFRRTVSSQTQGRQRRGRGPLAGRGEAKEPQRPPTRTDAAVHALQAHRRGRHSHQAHRRSGGAQGRLLGGHRCDHRHDRSGPARAEDDGQKQVRPQGQDHAANGLHPAAPRLHAVPLRPPRVRGGARRQRRGPRDRRDAPPRRTAGGRRARARGAQERSRGAAARAERRHRPRGGRGAPRRGPDRRRRGPRPREGGPRRADRARRGGARARAAGRHGGAGGAGGGARRRAQDAGVRHVVAGPRGASPVGERAAAAGAGAAAVGEGRADRGGGGAEGRRGGGAVGVRGGERGAGGRGGAAAQEEVELREQARALERGAGGAAAASAASGAAARLEAVSAELSGAKARLLEVEAALRVSSEGRARAEDALREERAGGERARAQAAREAAAAAAREEELGGIVSELRDQKAMLETSRAGVQAECEAAKQEVLALTKGKAAADAKLASLDEELLRWRNASSQTQQELERMRTRREALEAESQDNASVVASLKEELQVLQQRQLMSEQEVGMKAGAVRTLEARAGSLEEEVARLQGRVQEGEAVRRRLHNTIQELKGNIRVYCRARPAADGMEVDGARPTLAFPANTERAEAGIDISMPTTDAKYRGQTHKFDFDKVFGPGSSQGEVYDEIGQLVQSSLDGYKVCVFAYGQTGSGKTHTMLGTEEDPGMVPRAMRQVFAQSQVLAEQGWSYDVSAMMLEVYNEQYRDLLARKGAEVKLGDAKVVHDDTTGLTTVTNMTQVSVRSPEQAEDLVGRAMRARAVASTNMNDQSSRSHCVFMVKLVGKNPSLGQEVHGCLNLVDLAGSERLARSGATGSTLTETQNINKSLSALGDVITALAEKRAHVPYRNSKLTHLLMPALGGDSKTLMFLNVSSEAESAPETLSSLRFGEKVNGCQMKTASKNVKKSAGTPLKKK